MPPSLEVYESFTQAIPVKVLAGKANGVAAAASSIRLESDEKHDLVLRYYRAFIADLCENFKGGHPGFVPFTPCSDIIVF